MRKEDLVYCVIADDWQPFADWAMAHFLRTDAIASGTEGAVAIAAGRSPAKSKTVVYSVQVDDLQIEVTVVDSSGGTGDAVVAMLIHRKLARNGLVSTKWAKFFSTRKNTDQIIFYGG